MLGRLKHTSDVVVREGQFSKARIYLLQISKQERKTEERKHKVSKTKGNT